MPLPDTINFLNQSIEAWEDAIASNEKAKIEAELMQNYSFQGGSNHFERAEGLHIRTV